MPPWNPSRFALSSTATQRPVATLVRRGYDDGRETLDSDGTYEIKRAGYNTSVPNYNFFVDLDGPAENYGNVQSSPYAYAPAAAVRGGGGRRRGKRVEEEEEE